MDIFIEQLSPKEWEKFCARMLRYHYGVNNFWEVPDAEKAIWQEGNIMQAGFQSLIGIVHFSLFYIPLNFDLLVK
tara:strand:- start:29301 stop:29525 length:225 start_codon:yes stop_codon:yes gene_type:complete